MTRAEVTRAYGLSIALSAAMLVTGCGGGGALPPYTAPISVSVSPSTVSVPLGGTQQFTATVTGTTNKAVIWSAGGVTGGNSTVGTISAAGLYTAPDAVPASASVTVTATSQADPSRSGSATVTVTIPTVTLLSISPIVAMQGTAGVSLEVNGAGFTSSSLVLFNSAAKPTTFVASSQLTVQLSSRDIAQPGTFPVSVQSGGQTAGPQNFYVVPTINSQLVSVAAGTESGNINVAVPALANPSLSVVAVGIGDTAGSVGISVPRGQTANVFLVGKGIVAGTFYMVTGNPADVTITQPLVADFTATKATTGVPSLPAVNFNLSVSPTATPGTRNILAINPAGEITAFVGGLLITP
jgi:hypothetical protein